MEITVYIDDDDIIDAVDAQSVVDNALESYFADNPVHDQMDWAEARAQGYLDDPSLDDRIARLIVANNQLNPSTGTSEEEIRKIVREEITRWVKSLGNVFANMTHTYTDKENNSE